MFASIMEDDIIYVIFIIPIIIKIRNVTNTNIT